MNRKPLAIALFLLTHSSVLAEPLIQLESPSCLRILRLLSSNQTPDGQVIRNAYSELLQLASDQTLELLESEDSDSRALSTFDRRVFEGLQLVREKARLMNSTNLSTFIDLLQEEKARRGIHQTHSNRASQEIHKAGAPQFAVPDAHGDSVFFSMSRDGKHLLVSNGTRLYMWDLQNRKLLWESPNKFISGKTPVALGERYIAIAHAKYINGVSKAGVEIRIYDKNTLDQIVEIWSPYKGEFPLNLSPLFWLSPTLLYIHGYEDRSSFTTDYYGQFTPVKINPSRAYKGPAHTYSPFISGSLGFLVEPRKMQSSVFIKDATTFKTLIEISHEKSPFRILALSPNGHHLLTLDRTNQMRLWTFNRSSEDSLSSTYKKFELEFELSTPAIWEVSHQAAVGLSSNGEYGVFGLKNGGYAIVNFNSDKTLIFDNEISEDFGEIKKIIISDDGNYALLFSDNEIALIDIPDGRVLSYLIHKLDSVHFGAISLSRDASILVIREKNPDRLTVYYLNQLTQEASE